MISLEFLNGVIVKTEELENLELKSDEKASEIYNFIISSNLKDNH